MSAFKDRVGAVVRMVRVGLPPADAFDKYEGQTAYREKLIKYVQAVTVSVQLSQADGLSISYEAYRELANGIFNNK